MSPKGTTSAIIIVSIAFAAAMIGSSILIADKDTAQTVTLMLITLWFIPFTYFINAKKRKSDKG